MSEDIFIVEEVMNQNYHNIILWCVLFGVSAFAILIASAIDFYTAIDAARVLKRDIKSAKMRETIRKILPYYSIVFLFLIVDIILSMLPFYNMPFLAVFIALCCVLIETKSINENLKLTKSSAADIPQAGAELIDKLDDLKEIITSINKGK